MLNKIKNNLCKSHRKFRFAIIYAQSIPFKEGTFDAVIANHMLYYMPDRPKVFSEIYRVLKYSGHFYATTNGGEHLRELIELVERVDLYAYKTIGHSEFNLENGSDQLSQWFSKVELNLYKDSLVVTEVEPLFAYVKSTKRLSNNKLTEFKKIIEKEIALNGAIYITKPSGIFKALKS
jgi:ubiquinone/menaquinone biosynthesis C-methylase UbiE